MDHTYDLDDITNKVQAILNNPPVRETKDAMWTKSINERMEKLGESYQFQGGYPRKLHLAPGDAPGWLCDHHWRVTQNRLMRTPLAMEIEWGFGDAKLIEMLPKALLRLMQCPAELRVLMFALNDRPPSENSETFVKIRGHIKSFKDTQAGDRYLLCGWSHSAQRVFTNRWTVTHADLAQRFFRKS